MHTLHHVTLQRPGGLALHVNPLGVAAVESLPDRTNRCVLYVGASTLRVMGTVDEVLDALGWTHPAIPKEAITPTVVPTDVPLPKSSDLDDLDTLTG